MNETTVETPVEKTSSKIEKLPGPDPLSTTNIELDDEEKRWRSDPNGRLMRKMKPAISQERLDELEARAKEIEGLLEDQSKAREAKDEARIHELDIQIAKRGLGGYDQLCLRLARKFGLLDDADRRNLRDAEVRRKQKAMTMKTRLVAGEFRAGNRLAT